MPSSEYTRNLRSTRRELGQCYRCGDVPEPFSSRCAACREKDEARWLRWRAKNPRKAAWKPRNDSRKERRNALQRIRRQLYGRADQGRTVQGFGSRRFPFQQTPRICPQCGNRFDARYSSRAFCKYACRKRYDRRHSETQAKQCFLKRVRRLFGGELPPADVLEMLRLLREFRKVAHPQPGRLYPTGRRDIEG